MTKKLFTLLLAVAASVGSMFAEEITSVSVAIETFPKVGDNIKSGWAIEPSNPEFNTLCKVTIPEGANYSVMQYSFRNVGGSFPEEAKFISDKTYWVEIYILAEGGYTFPVDGEGITDPSQITLDVTGGTEVSYNGGGDFLLYIMRSFVPVEATAIGNTAADAKTTKRIVNGQLLIEKNGRTFNALGAEVK